MIKIKKKYPKIRTRIICLSDGIDNKSQIKPLKLLESLISYDIILDSINFLEDSKPLTAVTLSSGGFAFFCKDQEEGYKIFESDSFLSLLHRFDPKKNLLVQENDISNNKLVYTEIPPPVKQPDQIKFKVQDIKKVLLKVHTAQPKFSSTISSLRFKRIIKELAFINKNPHPDIKIFPCEKDIQF